jgi:hypothetical protein
VTKLRLDQLPARVRKQIQASHPELEKLDRKSKSRAGVGLSAPCPGHCVCGEAFPNALRWQEHSDATGHGRWSIDLNKYHPD